MRLLLERLPEVDRNEALRYLRAGNSGALLDDDLTAAIAKLASLAQPAAAAVLLPLSWSEGLPHLGALALPGHAIERHLSGCDQGVVLGVTLGFATDRAIAAEGQLSAYRAMLLDAAATAAIEGVADEAERLLHRTLLNGQGCFKTRFSPGYGDFPLALQPALLELLDARRTLGMAVGPSLLLSPLKSVTALIGVTKWQTSRPPSGCDGCAMQKTCLYRTGK